MDRRRPVGTESATSCEQNLREIGTRIEFLQQKWPDLLRMPCAEQLWRRMVGGIYRIEMRSRGAWVLGHRKDRFRSQPWRYVDINVARNWAGSQSRSTSENRDRRRNGAA
jgi:hypothetical protein